MTARRYARLCSLAPTCPPVRPPVIPARRESIERHYGCSVWIPAFAGMTGGFGRLWGGNATLGYARALSTPPVIPAKAGIHRTPLWMLSMDTRFRGYDGRLWPVVGRQCNPWIRACAVHPPVIPAKAGIHRTPIWIISMDTRFRGCDGRLWPVVGRQCNPWIRACAVYPPSFPRRRESIERQYGCSVWIPAFAGVTGGFGRLWGGNATLGYARALSTPVIPAKAGIHRTPIWMLSMDTRIRGYDGNARIHAQRKYPLSRL
jgi:hypothetical protein